MKTLKIVLICGYKIRELDSLLLLKKELEQKLGAKVYIIGGISEIQRMYYQLYAIQPDIVFISQIVESVCRKLTSYILRSRGCVYVLPAEITVIKIIEDLLLNPDVSYNKFLTKMYIPGERYEKLINKTDISLDKVKIVGSPKIDCLVRKEGSEFYSRQKFSDLLGLDENKKNIFVFTSFVEANPEYLKQDQCFDTTFDKMMESNQCVKLTKKKYLQVVRQLCEDFPTHNIILKSHPLESPIEYQAIKSSNFRLVTNLSLYNCLASIDIAIHWNSTISTECWIKGIKTLQLAPYKKYDHFLSECHPGNPVLRTHPELKKAVVKYLDQDLEMRYKKFQNKYLAYNYYKLDGKSVERISADLQADVRRRKSTPTFLPIHDKKIKLILGLQNILGVSLSRRVVSWFLPHYNWRSAVENYLFID